MVEGLVIKYIPLGVFNYPLGYQQYWVGYSPVSHSLRGLMTPPSTATAVTTLAPDTLRSPYLAANDEQGFIDELLEGQPDAHAYFGRMKRENRQGPVVMGERTPLQELDTAAVARDLAEDKVTFIDARSHSEVHEGTVTGSLNIPAGKSVASYGAWSVNPASDKNPLVLLAPDQKQAQNMWDHLVRVGIDNVAGYVTSIKGLPESTPRLILPADLADFDAAMVLDVRNRTEHTAGRIPGSHQLSDGRVMWHLDELPTEGTIVTYCQSGVRCSSQRPTPGRLRRRRIRRQLRWLDYLAAITGVRVPQLNSGSIDSI